MKTNTNLFTNKKIQSLNAAIARHWSQELGLELDFAPVAETKKDKNQNDYLFLKCGDIELTADLEAKASEIFGSEKIRTLEKYGNLMIFENTPQVIKLKERKPYWFYDMRNISELAKEIGLHVFENENTGELEIYHNENCFINGQDESEQFLNDFRKEVINDEEIKASPKALKVIENEIQDLEDKSYFDKFYLKVNCQDQEQLCSYFEGLFPNGEIIGVYAPIMKKEGEPIDKLAKGIFWEFMQNSPLYKQGFPMRFRLSSQEPERIIPHVDLPDMGADKFIETAPPKTMAEAFKRLRNR